MSKSDYPKTESVAPLEDFKLRVTFANEVEKIYDCRPLLTEPPFTLLQSPFVSLRTLTCAENAELR